MDKQRLLHIVKKAWNSYSQVPLSLSASSISPVIAEQLYWCIYAGIEPNDRSLLLAINTDTAFELAVSMFGLPKEDINDTNVEDSVAEMVNIIAGNIITENESLGRVEIPHRIEKSSFQKGYKFWPVEIDLLLSAHDKAFYVAIIRQNPIENYARNCP